MVILPWGCWAVASFLPALSVDKTSNKRGVYSQADRLGQGSEGLGAGLSRRALQAKGATGMLLKEADTALLKSLQPSICPVPLRAI